jgi:hypothetical protein
VHFDVESAKHRIDVMFSEGVARLVAERTGSERQMAHAGSQQEDNAACLLMLGEDNLEKSAAKKSVGSRVGSAANHAYTVTVE